MSQRDAFDRVMASLHDAMLDDAHWPDTSALIDNACGITGNKLVVAEEHAPGDVKVLFARFYRRRRRNLALERAYFRTYYPHDERVPRIRQLPDGHLAHVTDLYTEQELKTSPTYNELLVRCGGQNSLNVRMDGPGGSRIVWATTDPKRSNDWSSGQIEMIQRILPHIRQFVRIRQAMANADALGVSFNNLLDITKLGVIYLDRRGRVIETNDRARGILRQGDGLSGEGGTLGALLPADNARLAKLLARVLPVSDDQGVSGSITLRRARGRPRLTLHVSPVGPRHKAFGVRHVAALALVVDPENGLEIDPNRMAALLGLTPREARVAVLLAEGLGVSDVAAATGRQESTIRWNLKRIYRKQGISRQAELVRLVLATAGFKGPSPSPSAPPDQP